MATFGFMLAYALVALAAPVFLNRIGVTNPVAMLAGAVGVLSMIFIFWANSLPQFIPGGAFPALSGVPQWLPVVFLVWVAIGVAWYLVARARSPELVRHIGTRFETSA